MYKPDRVIARKLREYDPYLFLEWNNQKGYFELWRTMAHGRRLITPVVQSIYEPHAPIQFAPLDERLLWWVVAADSWKSGGSKAHAMAWDRRWRDWEAKRTIQKRQEYRDMAKDLWNGANAFYATRHASKNSGRPNLEKRRPRSNGWIRPDMGGIANSRVFARSKANALKYGWRG